MWSTNSQGKQFRRKYKKGKEHLPDLIEDVSYCIEVDYKDLWVTACLKPTLVELL
jgi:hypothetical protein